MYLECIDIPWRTEQGHRVEDSKSTPSKAKDQEKPAITILSSTIKHVINIHEKQQCYWDISHDIKKHPHGEGVFYDKNKEDVAGKIEHLKMPHIKDTYIGMFWHGPQLQ